MKKKLFNYSDEKADESFDMIRQVKAEDDEQASVDSEDVAAMKNELNQCMFTDLNQDEQFIHEI